MEGDQSALRQGQKCSHFNPLPPHGGRRDYVRTQLPGYDISIHSLRMEGDVPCLLPPQIRCRTFQSTPSAWRETVTDENENPIIETISIHSLRMEGDSIWFTSFFSPQNFNPLPPHGGRREKRLCHHSPQPFQSTPSAWRETGYVKFSASTAANFNPLPPHGGRHGGSSEKLPSMLISIHSLRMEGDPTHSQSVPRCKKFQSTPSAWRETPFGELLHSWIYISIHSLRMEGDKMSRKRAQNPCNFNPLPPHGGRPKADKAKLNQLVFQSTPSAWRETHHCGCCTAALCISIHSLRMEGDQQDNDHRRHRTDFNPLPPHGGRPDQQLYLYLRFRYFNPLPPHGGRLLAHSCIPRHQTFQSTPSAWRETFYDSGVILMEKISIHSLRMEGDAPLLSLVRSQTVFQSTPSAWRETCDSQKSRILSQDFNPLPPHGGRLAAHFYFCFVLTFQSTPSAWRETVMYIKLLPEIEISIHSLRMEGDFLSDAGVPENIVFQSTPSAWRETFTTAIFFYAQTISIHSLRMEGDRCSLSSSCP